MHNPVGKSLFQLSFPLFLQSLITFAVTAIDMMIWSKHSPQTAMALSVAGQTLNVATHLSAVMGIGAVITISQQLGRNQPQDARITAEVACVVNAAFGVLLGLVLGVFGPIAAHYMAPNADAAADATLYLRIAGCSMVFLCFGNAVVACLRSFGMSRLVMALGLFGTALYLSLEYLLVLGAGPTQPLGTLGAGLANLATRIVTALALVVVAYRVLQIRLRPATALRLLQQARKMAALALPSVSAYIVYGIYQMILLGVIASDGEVAVLSRAYVLIAMSFPTLVIMAVCQGSEVLIGYRLGAGDLQAVQRQGMRSSWIAAAMATVSAIMLYAASDIFLGLFSDDPKVHEVGRELLWLTIFLQPCFAFNMILFHALRAVEDVRWPALASHVLTWGLGLPLAWILCVPAELGAKGVWLAFIIEEFAKALAMLYRWHHRQRLPVSGNLSENVA